MEHPNHARGSPITPAAVASAADRATETTEAKALVRRWFAVRLKSGSSADARTVSEEVSAEAFVDHEGTREGSTRDRGQWQAALVDTVFATFSDVEVHIEHLFAEQDLVVVRYAFEPTPARSWAARPRDDGSGIRRT